METIVLFLSKPDCSRDHFFKILEMGLSVQKMSMMDSYSGSNLQCFREKKCSLTFPVKLSWKTLSLKHIVTVFNLSKKDPATRHALKIKVSFKSF